MTSEDNDLTRRDFLRETATGSAVVAGYVGIALTTDALSHAQEPTPPSVTGSSSHHPYSYSDG